MTGMDMSNAPTAAILWAFYLQLLTVGAVWIVVFRIVWVKSRSDRSTLPALFRQMTQYVSRCSNRELLRLGLGCLWILDGVLQAQPDMSSEFVPYVLVPIISGQPLFLANVMERGAILWGSHPMATDVLVVWFQVTLGALILLPVRKLQTYGLAASIVWSVGVWVFGQGIGGLLTGEPNWFTAFPGSALFYIFAAWLLLIRESDWVNGEVAQITRRVWVVLFLSSAFIQAWPDSGNWRMTTVGSWVLSMADMPEPTGVSTPLKILAHAFTVHPVGWNVTFTVILLALGLSWLIRARSRLTFVATLIWLSITWYVGQDFGVLGGLGTDPGEAVILALLLLTTAHGTKRNRGME